MTTFPTLYKKNSNGSIQQWTIAVDGATILTTYGQVGGALQTTPDTLKEGKNAGKANATTAEEQAVKEAEAKHLKQKKKGYVETPEAAQAGEEDDVIEGGYKPMLAEVWGDHSHKIDFSRGLAVQPKLNGHRCGATNGEGKVELWSRTRKRITSMPHLVEELERLYEAVGDPLWKPDGELYRHGMTFQQLTRLIRHKDPQPGHEVVEYHLYDLVSPEGFRERNAKLQEILGKVRLAKIVYVPTFFVSDPAEVMALFAKFRADLYEGLMARLLGRGYEHKRTDHLLKLKEFKDGEFRAKRIEESRGRYAGTAKRVVCEMADGREFTATMSGDIEHVRDLYDHPEKILGKMINVQFFELTDDGIPLWPVGNHVMEDTGCLA